MRWINISRGPDSVLNHILSSASGAPSSSEFIPIKPMVAGAEGAPESCAGHSRSSSRDRGRVLPQPHLVFDDATTLEAAVGMLDPQPTLVQCLISQLSFSWWGRGFESHRGH